jgi:flagellar motor protein MotB
LPTFTARPDATATTGQYGESVYTACHQVTGQQCDGGGGAGGGGGAQGGSAGFVEFGSGTSDEWFGLGGYPGQNSTGGLGGLSASYSFYGDNNANGSVVISYTTGAPNAPTNVNGTPGNSNVFLYWSAPTTSGSGGVTSYVVRYATSPFSSWTTASMCTGATTSCTVTGLTNDTGYEFEVAAVNTIGQGSFSVPSGVLTPSGPPGAPNVSGVTPSDGSLSLAFSAASSSLPLLDYQYSLDNGATWVSSGDTSSPLVISGLTNGTLYSVLLRGVSAAGNGASSSPATGTPSALPGAPTITTITPGLDGTSLGVSFVPGYTGGSTISSYQYATSVGAGTNAFGSWTTASGTTSPLTITGLANGTTYSVELRAMNADGAGPSSVYVVGATLTVPNAPTISSLTPGDSSIKVTYGAYTSSNDGGSAISGIDYSLDGGSTWVSAGTLANPFTISSLNNGTAYNVLLRADNGVGSSTTSSSSSATPFTVPGVPTQVLATGGPASAQVSWNAPLSNGGSTVLSYTVSAFSAATGGSAIATCTAATLTCAVSGLTNDMTYYFSVVATNAAGVGPISNPRVATLPVALPGAPTLSSLTAGNSYLSVPFSAGTYDTNDPITAYQYSVDGGAHWQNATGTTSPLTISGLMNGTSYTVELRAMSAVGPGAASNSEPGAPYAAPDPTANATTSYVAGSGQVTVSWLAPNNNGAAISSYTVTAFTAAVGGTQKTSCTTTTLSCTLSGLTNGTTYYISIQSINVFSQYSLRSSPLIPVVSGSTSVVSLGESPASSTYGTSVTLTATVTSGATGTINFESGGASIATCGAVTIVSNGAQCVTTALPTGSDSLQAAYSGNSTYASSVSASATYVVSVANQSALSFSPTSTTFVVSPRSGIALTASGGSTSGTLSYAVSGVGNVAGCSVTGSSLTYSSAGSCSITATMAGNANYNPVSSTATTFTVNQSTSATSLSPSPSSSTYGASVTLSATVTSGATGTINFESGGSTIGTCGAVAIVSGSAQCVTSALPTGSDSLQALYSGDVDFQDSSSTASSFAVALASQSTLTVTSVSGTTGFDLTLTSSGGSGTGSVTYVVSSGTTTCSQPSLGQLHTTGAGTCLVTATKAASTSYLSTSSSATTVAFSQTQTLSFTSLAPTNANVGGTYQPTASSTANLSVSITVDSSSSAVCSLSGAVVTFTAIGNCVLDANQPGDANHTAATQVQQSFAVTNAVAHDVPSAPRNVVASSSPSGVRVSWSLPASSGSFPIVDYVVASSPGGAICTTTTAASCTLSGLTPGTSYTLSVVAINQSGDSPAGVATFLVPASLTVPSAPRGVKASISGGVAVVAWTVPASDGGSTLTSYAVVASPSGAHCHTTGATSCRVSGLKSGTTYTFSVVALNAIGSSAPGAVAVKSSSASSSFPSTGRFAVTTNFAFGSFTLTALDKRALTELATRIVKDKILSLTLSGYTDDIGSATFNSVLSRERAVAVGQFLMARVLRLGYHGLTLHEFGKGILTSSANRSLDRTVTIAY